MVESDVDICNIALGKLGADVITSLTQNSKSARLCNKYWAHVRDLILRGHDWNCASTYASIASLADVPIPDDWDYQYQLPVDPYCLNIRELPDAKTAPYKVVGRTLYTNESSPIVIRYTQRMTNVADMDVLLVDVIACKLAEQMAYDLTHSASVADRMERKYAMAMIDAIDANIIEVDAPYTIASPSERDKAVTTKSWTGAGRA
jgi:hypothetical protein